jgi:O-antigen/teichoic acid export membrane protein
MIHAAKSRLIRMLRWSERYTKTDMVYFVSGNFWLNLSRVFSVATGIVFTITFANLFPQEIFGTYKYVLALAGIIGGFTLGGLGSAVTRAIAQGHKNVVHKVYRIGLLWNIPASIAALGMSLYYFWFGNMVLGTGLLLIAVTNPFNQLGLYKSIFLGEKDFKSLTIYNIPRSVIPTICIILALVLTKSLMVVLATYFISNLLVGWLIYELALKKIPHQKRSKY